MESVTLGRYSETAARDAEICLRFPHDLAPWATANRVATFLDAWLEKSLSARGMSAQDFNFVVNELVENAVKYAKDCTIELSVGFQPSSLVIGMSHAIAAERSQKYFELATALVERAPEQLFMEIIEKNSSSTAQTGAGLGLVSLRQDYMADLAFLFNRDEFRVHSVSTQVLLPLHEAEAHASS